MIRLPSKLESALSVAHRKRVDKGQVLLYQGDPVTEVIFLAGGIVKMYDIDEEGNEKILHILKAPGVIPLALFSANDVVTRWFYASLTDCEVSVVSRDTLDELMSTDFETTSFLMHWYSREVHEILTRLNSLSKTMARDKVVAALKYLATFHLHVGRGRWHKVTFPVTHQLLADFTGVSRESVTACLGEFHEQKLTKMGPHSTLMINRDKLFKQY